MTSYRDYTSVSSPSYNPDNSICLIMTAENIEGQFPYTAVNDPKDPSFELYEMAVKGEFGDIAPCPEERYELLRVCQREARERELTQLIDEANTICQPLAEEKDLGIISDSDLVRYKVWAIYRQSLRKVDLSVDEPAWPKRPE